MSGTAAEIQDGLQHTDLNARVVDINRLHSELMRIRISRPRDFPPVEAGQYTVLGLPVRAKREDGLPPDADAMRRPDRLIRRAYSIACPMLINDQITTIDSQKWLEFYITLVRRNSDSPPMLTPRLFALQPGDPVELGQSARGHYTLEHLGPDDHVLFLATGTGEAPHNAMTAELLARGHRGRIVNATCVRYEQDLGYLETHRQLESLFPNYRYIPLSTREPQNLDRTRNDYIGKRYLQDLFADSSFREEIGFTDPDGWHSYLCGNPSMIGAPSRSSRSSSDVPTDGMIALLTSLGMQLDLPRRPGNIHFEKYW